MATPSNRSPFKVQLVNRSRSVSPSTNNHQSENSWVSMVLEYQEQTAHESNDENTLRTSFSHSPSKCSTVNSGSNPRASFHSSTKARSLDASTIASMRIHSIMDVVANATGSICDDDDQAGSNENHPTSSTSQKIWSDEPAPEASGITLPQKQEVIDNFPDKNPFDGIIMDSQDETEQNPSVNEVISVETVTSAPPQELEAVNNLVSENPFDGIMMDSQDEIEQKPSIKEVISLETVTSPALREGVDSRELFDVTSEDVLEVPSAAILFDSQLDVFKPTKQNPRLVKDIFQAHNPFEQYFKSQGSEDSYIFTHPASEESDDPYCFEISHGSNLLAQNTLYASSDAFSGVESNVEATNDLEVPPLKSQSESCDEDKSYGLTQDNDDAISNNDLNRSPTQETYGNLSSATDITPSQSNLDMTAPLTPKERYLAAVQQSSSSRTSLGPVSPRDRYLLAVRQAAAKCKTMVTSPREIVTGPDLTPKSTVKAQIKRVQGGVDQANNLEASSVLFIPTCSPQQIQMHQASSPCCSKSDDDEEEEQHEFGSPMFQTFSNAAEFSVGAVELDDSSKHSLNKFPTLQPRMSTSSGFYTYLEAVSGLTSDELPVKQQIDAGTDTSPAKSYLQLDLEAAGSSQRSESEDGDPVPSVNGLSAIDALRNSLAVIWNSRPIPRMPSGQGEPHKSESNETISPAGSHAARGTASPESADLSTKKQLDACCQIPPGPEAGAGAMESLRSSLMMIWNSKPKPQILNSTLTLTKTMSEKESLKADPLLSRTKDVESQAQEQILRSPRGRPVVRTTIGMEGKASERPSKSPPVHSIANSSKFIERSVQEHPSISSRGHPVVSKSKDMDSVFQERPKRSPQVHRGFSDYKRERVSSEDSDASSYRRTEKKKTRRSDGLSSASQRPPGRHTGAPTGSQYLVSSQCGRSTSRERTTNTTPPNEDPYGRGLLGNQSSYDSLDEFMESNCPADPYGNPPRHNASVSPVQAALTTKTEDSFIKSALKAKPIDSSSVVSSSTNTPQKRDWHPPDQERKEHDTMVRAILERPSLIDKSIRDSRQPRYWDWRRVRKWSFIAIAMLLFIATITGCLACGITGECSRKNEETIQENQPLFLNVPTYTQESLKLLHSAQARAYSWLESDPYRSSYSESRMMQRFALATLYYSTRIAQNWTVSTSWLSYEIHECYWFSSYEGMDNCKDDHITHLVLKKNNLRGNIPPELALLTLLVELDLSRNVLIGPIPEQLLALTSLQVLSFEKNELNGNIPSQLGTFTSLTSLSLATNELKGTIPSEVGMLSTLKYFRLFYNYLTGAVPTQVGFLSNLEIFDVDVNNLSGTIPSQLGKLELLEELWLDWNKFLGPIPSELGLLNNLIKLYLGRAFVEDELRYDDWRGSGDYVIPTELGQLSNLKELYLDNNNMTGIIPGELSALTNLEKATLDNNLLNDSISPGICALFGGELESLSIDCAEVLCSCDCTCV